MAVKKVANSVNGKLLLTIGNPYIELFVWLGVTLFVLVFQSSLIKHLTQHTHEKQFIWNYEQSALSKQEQKTLQMR